MTEIVETGNSSPGETPFTPAGPVSRAFMEDPSFVRGIMGPLGSGKSTACVMEILGRAQEQAPDRDGIRWTRWAIIRNSYPELKSTTIKTWSEWCPTLYGRFNQDSPITHHIKTQELDMEVLFLALDRDEDVRKLLSLELTGAWLNEAREIPKTILDALTGRVGRYPSKMKGGCTWSGIIMDTNPPDDQSWWYKLAEEDKPKGWRFFKQPSGESPEAENLPNLPAGYYPRIKGGKDADWIKVYVDGQYGYVTEGKPVFPMFRDSIHVASQPFLPLETAPILIGVDFGLTPAAILGQKLIDGRWLVFDELITADMGIKRFAEVLVSYIRRTYPNNYVEIGFGDPAGNYKSELSDRTALDIMREYTDRKWKWKPAPTNDPVMRLEVVRNTLNRLVDGNPGILVSPRCKTLRKGFSGGYHYKFIRTGNGTQVHEKPHKNAYSHPHDALQYLLLGGGEHDVVMNKVHRRATVGRNEDRIAKDVNYDIFG